VFGIEAYASQELFYLLFGVFILVGIFLWSYHWRAARAAQFAHINSMEKIADTISKPKRIVKRVLLCLAYLLLVFAIMRPQGNPDQKLNGPETDKQDKKISASISMEEIKEDGDGGAKVKIRESARDIIFLLDVSASMGAEDLYPNRLSKAKEMINDIVSALDGEHVGLVIFTSVPSVKCVLTLDYTYFRQVLAKVEINDNDFAGTKFGPALSEIIHKQFDFSENKYKELIIITDGGDTDIEGLSGADRTAAENAIYALSAEAYSAKGIRIHTVGIGTKAGSIVLGVKDDQGRAVKSSLNDEFLRKISEKAKGINVSAADNFVDMKAIYLDKIAAGNQEEISKEVEIDKDRLNELVEKQKEEGEQKIVYQEFYVWPLLLALLLLVLEFFITDKKNSKQHLEQSTP
jgi:Ca-activated chloride channel family protein